MDVVVDAVVVGAVSVRVNEIACIGGRKGSTGRDFWYGKLRIIVLDFSMTLAKM